MHADDPSVQAYIHCVFSTSRKEGFGPGRVSPLVPVQSRTGTNGGISPGSCAQGPRGPFVPVRLDLLVPVGATNRD